jgi:hypothetical protein
MEPELVSTPPHIFLRYHYLSLFLQILRRTIKTNEKEKMRSPRVL